MRFAEVFCWILVIQLVLWHLSSTCHNQLEVIILKCAQNISWLAEKGSSVWSFLHLQEQFLQTIYNYLTLMQLNPFYSRSCLWGTYWNNHVLHTGYLSTHGRVSIMPISSPVHSPDCSGESPGVAEIPTCTVPVRHIFSCGRSWEFDYLVMGHCIVPNQCIISSLLGIAGESLDHPGNWGLSRYSVYTGKAW